MLRYNNFGTISPLAQWFRLTFNVEGRWCPQVNIGRCVRAAAAAAVGCGPKRRHATVKLDIVQARRHVDGFPVHQRGVHRAETADVVGAGDFCRCLLETPDDRDPPCTGVENLTLDLNHIRLTDAVIGSRHVPATVLRFWRKRANKLLINK